MKNKENIRNIKIDGSDFKVPHNVSGAYLMACVGKDANYVLYRESDGDIEDQLISVDRIISVENGDRFYCSIKAYFA